MAQRSTYAGSSNQLAKQVERGTGRRRHALRAIRSACAEFLELRRLFAGSVVINEIHYNPDISTEQVEFVELHNPGDAPVDLSGASFSGITYTFPAGTTLPAGGYVVVAQDIPDFQAKFAMTPYGPFTGKLSNEGEKITIRSSTNVVLDEVDYGDNFPWPIVGDAPGRSIELINPNLDNDLGGSWRSFVPSTDTTLIASGSAWKYRKGTAADAPSGTTWRTSSFNDSAWASGATPIGYDSTLTMATTLSDMNGNYTSVYLRKTFTVANVSAFASARLEAFYDDGFYLYVNGVLAATVNAPANANPARTATASSAVEQSGYTTFNIPTTMLQTGTNLIALQFMNSSLGGSTDAFFDGRLIGASGASGPTPGRINAAFSANAAPQMRQVAHSPKTPTSGQNVTITTKVTDPQGVQSVTLSYQLVNPGSYIALEDAAYNNPANWTSVTMVDNGTAGDAVAGDDTYTAVLPGSLQTNRRLVRYRITSVDMLGASVTGPYADDPQPNFAYYVYDGVPNWSGAVNPAGSGPVATPTTYGPSAMNSTAVYQLITKKQDHLNSQHLPGSNNGSGYTGDSYLWSGAFVYDGVVYDHIHYRARGGVWRYAMGKNMWKIDFNDGHDFQPRDAYGNLYPVKWTKLNLGANIQQADNGNRGEQGLFETLGFDLYNKAGVSGSFTVPVHFRIVENALPDNGTANQYDDDFQGLYLAVEQDNGRFLDAHDLPDGNLYKMENGTGPGGGSLNNQGPTQPDDNSDLVAFKALLAASTTASAANEAALRDAIDLDAYFAFRAITKGIHHNDIGFGKNYFLYHNPEGGPAGGIEGNWQIIPWDLDLTWYTTYEPGGGDVDPLEAAVMAQPNLVKEYQNKLREIRDLLYNQEQVGIMADAYAALVNPGGGAAAGAAPSLVEADRAMWDYNPIMTSSSVNSGKAGAGRFYQKGQAPAPLTFASMVARLKTWTGTRSTFIDNTVLTAAADAMAPARGNVTYTGLPGFSPTQLKFATTGFVPGNQGGSFVAMKWRIADITAVAPGTPPNYEIDAAWESGVINTFNSNITIPASAVTTGRTYRVRVRFLDSNGRWSHWSNVSAGVSQFTVGAADSSVRDALRVTELNHNPAANPVSGSFGAQDYEFIEFRNTGATEINLDGVRFTAGIEFNFPAQTLLPGEIGVVVKNAAAFAARYGPGARVLGVINSGAFAADGETLTIVDAGGSVIQSFAFGVSGAWPASANGGGSSIVVVSPASNPNLSLASSWRASTTIGGTPGVATVITTNDGTAQRSMVKSMTIALDVAAASWDAGAFELVHTPPGGGSTTTVGLIATPSGDGLTVVLTFVGAGIVGGSLADGDYNLIVRPALIRDGAGAAAGYATHSVAFHRLFGDADGDRDVDGTDSRGFRTALGAEPGSPLYDSVFDFDGDGDVDGSDSREFRTRLGT